MIQGHICQLHHVLSGESVEHLLTCVESLSNIQGRDHSVMCCYHKLPVCLGSCPCQHHFQPPSILRLEQAPVLGDEAVDTSPDTRGTYCWEATKMLISSSSSFHQSSCLPQKVSLPV